jgi:peptidoglycan/LPS O-acetylase OafA/YrhL
MKVFNNKLVLFISSSSLWIYLWHILYLFAWAWARNSIPNYLNNFVFEIFIVLGLASLTTYIQRRLIRWLTRILNVGVDGQKTLTVLFLK